MTFFDQVYNRLFGKKSGAPMVHEVLKRSEYYLDQYEFWKESILSDEMLSAVKTSLKLKEQGVLKTPEVHAFAGDYSNGFAITYNPEFDPTQFSFLFDLFAERVKEMGYKTSVSDLIMSEKKDYIETKEKHYLKPIVDQAEGPIDQKFGNVTVELIKIDEVPSFIRLMAHAYNDRQYKTPSSFDFLSDHLFQLNNQ